MDKNGKHGLWTIVVVAALAAAWIIDGKASAAPPAPNPLPVIWESLLNAEDNQGKHVARVVRMQIPEGWLVIVDAHGTTAVVVSDQRHAWLRGEPEAR